ncbi:MAG: hypothetical protein KGH78_03760 [Candidatus Micrarchaeota archaeon]|nr:hypothetical protein [Candidatus Micrarchaeota archaeon]
MLKNKNLKTASKQWHKTAAVLAILAIAIAITVLSMIGPIGVLFAAGTTFNGIGVNFIISGVCTPVLSNSLINFGSVTPGSFAPTANAETVTDSGSVGSNIVLYSTSTTTGNWVSGSLSFLVSNTVWDGASHASTIVGNQLSNTITTDTQIFVPVSSSNNLFFGLNVPVGQAAGTYTQGITVSLSC